MTKIIKYFFSCSSAFIDNDLSISIANEADSRIRNDQILMELVTSLKEELVREKIKTEILEERLNYFIEEEQVWIY